jgi:AcrR family transcriptional regulator
MRALATELGIGTMTLYGYFRSRDEILDALVDSLTAELTPDPEPGGDWRTQLRELALAVRVSHLLHPAIVELRLRRPLVSEGALRMTELAMGILRDAGFSPRDAARAYRALFVATFGFSAFGPDARGDEEERATLAAIERLDPADYPALTAASGEAASAMSDTAVFEFMLDRLLDGLEALRAAG